MGRKIAGFFGWRVLLPNSLVDKEALSPSNNKKSPSQKGSLVMVMVSALGSWPSASLIGVVHLIGFAGHNGAILQHSRWVVGWQAGWLASGVFCVCYWIFSRRELSLLSPTCLCVRE